MKLFIKILFIIHLLLPVHALAPGTSLDALKMQMIKEARAIYGEIYPLAKKKKLEDCFTTPTIGKKKMLMFWFNLADNKTLSAFKIIDQSV